MNKTLTLAERPQKVEPVQVDLFGDGTQRTLVYTIGTLQRLKQRLGKAVMGLRGSITDLDEEMLPTLIFEGLKHEPKRGVLCSCGHHAEDGIEPDVTEQDIIDIESPVFAYLLTCFSQAYTGSRPEQKKTVTEVTAEE